MKRSEIYFAGIQVPLDLIMILLASSVAYFLRSLPLLQGYISPVFNLSFRDYFIGVLILSPFILLIFAFEGLYATRVTRSLSEEVFKVARAATLALVVFIIVIFLNRVWFSSRFVIIVGWVLAVVLITIGRFLVRLFQKHLVKKSGIGRHRVLLIGSNPKINYIENYITRQPSLGFVVVQKIDAPSITTVKEVKKNYGIDEIIVGDSSFTDEELGKLLDYCQINNISYRYLPTTFQTSRLSMSMFAGEPVIEYLHTPLDGWGKIWKRAFDLVAGSALALLFSPLIGLIALLIKLEDPKGPVVYKNKRIGENGEEFSVYKFRYMYWKYCITKENPDFEKAVQFEQELIAKRNARQGGILYKIKDDPRRMKIGRFIEKFSLDELPQFWNVLRGEMSLVGPRPHQKREVEQYREYHRRLLTIKPGVTGMAQVSGRSDLAFEDEYRFDVFYIENWSPWLDIEICLRTALALIRRRKNQ